MLCLQSLHTPPLISPDATNTAGSNLHSVAWLLQLHSEKLNTGITIFYNTALKMYTSKTYFYYYKSMDLYMIYRL